MCEGGRLGPTGLASPGALVSWSCFSVGVVAVGPPSILSTDTAKSSGALSRFEITATFRDNQSQGIRGNDG